MAQYGRFHDFCRDSGDTFSTIPVCNLFSESPSGEPFNGQHGGGYGGCVLTGIKLSQGHRLANLGSILIDGLAIVLAAALILRSDRKRAAVGRREMQLFLFGFMILSICEIFTIGGFPLDADVRRGFTAVHIATVTATSWILLLNALIGFQVMEDGTPLSIGLVFFSAAAFFIGTGYIAFDTAFSWTGYWDSTLGAPNKATALYTLYLLAPLVFIVLYFLLEFFLVTFILKERRPLLYLLAAGLLFALGQIFQFVVSVHICTGTHGKINGGFFESLFTLGSVVMVWVFWSSITEDDWPVAVPREKRIQQRHVLHKGDRAFGLGRDWTIEMRQDLEKRTMHLLNDDGDQSNNDGETIDTRGQNRQKEGRLATIRSRHWYRWRTHSVASEESHSTLSSPDSAALVPIMQDQNGSDSSSPAEYYFVGHRAYLKPKVRRDQGSSNLQRDRHKSHRSNVNQSEHLDQSSLETCSDCDRNGMSMAAAGTLPRVSSVGHAQSSRRMSTLEPIVSRIQPHKLCYKHTRCVPDTSQVSSGPWKKSRKRASSGEASNSSTEPSGEGSITRSSTHEQGESHRGSAVTPYLSRKMRRAQQTDTTENTTPSARSKKSSKNESRYSIPSPSTMPKKLLAPALEQQSLNSTPWEQTALDDLRSFSPMEIYENPGGSSNIQRRHSHHSENCQHSDLNSGLTERDGHDPLPSGACVAGSSHRYRLHEQAGRRFSEYSQTMNDFAHPAYRDRLTSPYQQLTVDGYVDIGAMQGRGQDFPILAPTPRRRSSVNMLEEDLVSSTTSTGSAKATPIAHFIGSLRRSLTGNTNNTSGSRYSSEDVIHKQSEISVRRSSSEQMSQESDQYSKQLSNIGRGKQRVMDLSKLPPRELHSQISESGQGSKPLTWSSSGSMSSPEPFLSTLADDDSIGPKLPWTQELFQKGLVVEDLKKQVSRLDRRASTNLRALLQEVDEFIRGNDVQPDKLDDVAIMLGKLEKEEQSRVCEAHANEQNVLERLAKNEYRKLQTSKFLRDSHPISSARASSPTSPGPPSQPASFFPPVDPPVSVDEAAYHECNEGDEIGIAL